ncbi:MAG: hypothetical protein J2P38_06780 [Candidatus Dormibacteraeota bacterium]|nr:hypothetical protein [Candidatus Dormibacteraeota bacterium]
MRWEEVAAAQPRLGRIAQEALLGPGVVLVGTTRRDGTPRVSGVEPLVMDGELWLSMMASPKVVDLRRDPRLLVRSVLTKPAGEVEVLLRGSVREAGDADLQARYAEVAALALGWRPVVGQFALFAVDIDDVSYLRFDPATGDQHVARWPAGVEYTRQHLTPTSYGPRRPASGILT